MNTTTAHILLVETAEGGNVAVRFPSAAAAQDWDDDHPDIETIGLVPVVSATAAIRLARS